MLWTPQTFLVFVCPCRLKNQHSGLGPLLAYLEISDRLVKCCSQKWRAGYEKYRPSVVVLTGITVPRIVRDLTARSVADDPVGADEPSRNPRP